MDAAATAKLRLRSALMSLEDRNLDSQGAFSAKHLIDALAASSQACTFLKDLSSGLEKCRRGAASHRLLLLAYLLGTHPHLSVTPAISQLVANLVVYLQRQHHSTNLDELGSLGSRLGEALITACERAVRSLLTGEFDDDDDAALDIAPQQDATGPDAPVLQSAWVADQVLVPLLRVACRGPEKGAMVAGCAVLCPLVEALAAGRHLSALAGAVSRLTSCAFSLLGATAMGNKAAGVLQLMRAATQVLGTTLDTGLAKRMMLATMSGLECVDDWQVRREAAALIQALAELAMQQGAGDAAGTVGWLVTQHRDFLLQTVDMVRFDKIPGVRKAYQDAVAALGRLPDAPPRSGSAGTFSGFASPLVASPERPQRKNELPASQAHTPKPTPGHSRQQQPGKAGTQPPPQQQQLKAQPRQAPAGPAPAPAGSRSGPAYAAAHSNARRRSYLDAGASDQGPARSGQAAPQPAGRSDSTAQQQQHAARTSPTRCDSVPDLLPSKSPRLRPGQRTQPPPQPKSVQRPRPAAPAKSRFRENLIKPVPKPAEARGRAHAPRADAAQQDSADDAAAAGPRYGVVLSPPRRFQRADPARVSLGWPRTYQPPEGVSKFQRPTDGAEDFGVQVFAKPRPPSPPQPPAVQQVPPISPRKQLIAAVAEAAAAAGSPAYLVNVRYDGDDNSPPAQPVPRARSQSPGAARSRSRSPAYRAAARSGQGAPDDDGSDVISERYMTARVQAVHARLSQGTPLAGASAAAGRSQMLVSVLPPDHDGGPQGSSPSRRLGSPAGRHRTMTVRVSGATTAPSSARKARRRWEAPPPVSAAAAATPTDHGLAAGSIAAATVATQLQGLLHQAAAAQAGLQAYLVATGPLMMRGDAHATAAANNAASTALDSAAMRLEGVLASLIGHGQGQQQHYPQAPYAQPVQGGDAAAAADHTAHFPMAPSLPAQPQGQPDGAYTEDGLPGGAAAGAGGTTGALRGLIDQMQAAGATLQRSLSAPLHSQPLPDGPQHGQAGTTASASPSGTGGPASPVQRMPSWNNLVSRMVGGGGGQAQVSNTWSMAPVPNAARRGVQTSGATPSKWPSPAAVAAAGATEGLSRTTENLQRLIERAEALQVSGSSGAGALPQASPWQAASQAPSWPPGLGQQQQQQPASPVPSHLLFEKAPSLAEYARRGSVSSSPRRSGRQGSRADDLSQLQHMQDQQQQQQQQWSLRPEGGAAAGEDEDEFLMSSFGGAADGGGAALAPPFGLRGGGAGAQPHRVIDFKPLLPVATIRPPVQQAAATHQSPSELSFSPGFTADSRYAEGGPYAVATVDGGGMQYLHAAEADSGMQPSTSAFAVDRHGRRYGLPSREPRGLPDWLRHPSQPGSLSPSLRYHAAASARGGERAALPSSYASAFAHSAARPEPAGGVAHIGLPHFPQSPSGASPLSIGLEEPLVVELRLGSALGDHVQAASAPGQAAPPGQGAGNQAPHDRPTSPPVHAAPYSAHSAAGLGSAGDLVAMASVVDVHQQQQQQQQDPSPRSLSSSPRAPLAAALGTAPTPQWPPPHPSAGAVAPGATSMDTASPPTAAQAAGDEEHDAAACYPLPALVVAAAPMLFVEQPSSRLASPYGSPARGQHASAVAGDADWAMSMFPATLAAMHSRTLSPPRGGRSPPRTQPLGGAVGSPPPLHPHAVQQQQQPATRYAADDGSLYGAQAAVSAGPLDVEAEEAAAASAVVFRTAVDMLRPESLQALRASASGLARSSVEAVREVEGLVVRLTLLREQLAYGRGERVTTQLPQLAEEEVEERWYPQSAHAEAAAAAPPYGFVQPGYEVEEGVYGTATEQPHSVALHGGAAAGWPVQEAHWEGPGAVWGSTEQTPPPRTVAGSRQGGEGSPVDSSPAFVLPLR